MKKVLALALSAVLVAAFLVACGGDSGSSSSTVSSTGGSSASSSQSVAEPAGPTYGGNDISEYQELRFLYVVPMVYPDFDMVWEHINEVVLEKINAKVIPTTLLMSDHNERYELELSAGEPYDVVVAASGWLHYDTSAPKGLYKEITLDLIQQYMPLTVEYQKDIELHMEQNSLGGICYMVPASFTNIGINTTALAYREDLRVANGSPEITDLATLEEYYDGIVANNPGVFPYAVTQNNNELKNIILNLRNNMIKVPSTIIEDYFNIHWTSGMTPEQAIADITWCGYDDAYVEFAHKMKEWADKGYWSRSAIADTTQLRDIFDTGMSGSFAQNTGTLGNSLNAVNAAGWEGKMVDIYPEATRFMGPTTSGLCVPYNSEKMERALMFIDLMKYDPICNPTYRWGIEGVHWNWVDEDLRIWERGPNNADEANQGYQWGQGSWGVSSPEFEPRDMVGANEDAIRIYNAWKAAGQNSPLSGFTIDQVPIENEIANLTDIRARYLYLLDLGLVDDVEATIAEMNKAAEDAGLQKVIDEIAAQGAAWLAKNA